MSRNIPNGGGDTDEEKRKKSDINVDIGTSRPLQILDILLIMAQRRNNQLVADPQTINYDVFPEPEVDDGFPPLLSPRADPFTRPLQTNRSVKDALYLGIFRIFFMCWLIVIILAFTIGNLRNLQPPVDSEGRRCGVDIQVKDKPYLLFFDITKYNNGSYSTTSTCLPECPQTAFLYKRDVTQDVKSLIPKLICKEGVDLQSIKNWNELDKYVKEAKCAELYLESTSLFNRCVPTSIPDELQGRISHATIAQLKKFIKIDIATRSMFHYFYLQGVSEAKYILIGFTLLAGALSITYVVAFRWLAKFLVSSSMYILGAVILLCICQGAKAFSFDQTQIFALVASIMLSLIFICFIPALFCAVNYQTIRACKMIKESCKLAGVSSLSLCIPIAAFFLCLLIVSLSTTAVLYLSTITGDIFQVKISDDGCNCPSSLNYTDGALCDPDIFMKECKTNINGTCFESGCYLFESTVPGYVTFMQIICWGGYWFIFLVILFNRTVLAGTFAEWYWTSDKALVPKFTLLKMMEITSWYHCGSLVRGSVSLLLEIPCDRLTRYTFSAIGIYGQSFGESHSLVKRLFQRDMNYDIVYIFDKKVTYLLKVGVLSITGLTTVIAWLSCASFFEEDITADMNVTGTSIFLVVIGIVSFHFAFIALEILKTAISTVCICFLEDNERNDDSAARPYLAPGPFLDVINGELSNIRYPNMYCYPVPMAERRRYAYR